MTLHPKTSIDPSDVSGTIRNLYSSQDAITAFAGGGQANAIMLTAVINRVTTVATGADSVRLPPAVPGASIVVLNRGAQSMNVFPSTGGIINALSADASIAVAAGAAGRFVCALAGRWDST